MHLDLAQRLVEELRLPVGEQDPADYLHGTGWLRCWDNGTTWPPDCPMTQTQRDRLWDLARAYALLLLALLAVPIVILTTGLVGTAWLTLLNGKASQRLQEVIRTVASAVAVARRASDH